MTRPEAMTLAREMYGAWSASEVVQCLSRHGVQVSVTTVKRWADPNADAMYQTDRRRARQRRRNDRVFARISQFRERGMSHNAIATVLSVDFGRDVSEAQVRYSVKTGRMSRELSRVLFDEFVPGVLRTAGLRVESRPESTRGEPLEGGCDVRLPTPTPWEMS